MRGKQVLKTSRDNAFFSLTNADAFKLGEKDPKPKRFNEYGQV